MLRASFFSGSVKFILLSPGLFWHSLFRLSSSFKLVVALNDCIYPDWAALVSSVITGEDLFPYSGEVGVWFGASTDRVSTLVAAVSAACPGSLLSVSAFSATCCLPPWSWGLTGRALDAWSYRGPSCGFCILLS